MAGILFSSSGALVGTVNSGDIYCRRLCAIEKTKQKRNGTVQIQLESLSFPLKIRN